MIVAKNPGALKKFRRTPWRFQQTIQIPETETLKDFIACILDHHGEMEEATATIENVVNGAGCLEKLGPAGEPVELQRDLSFQAESREEIAALLMAAFIDGPDFIFIPPPKPFMFMFYADNDYWITFYANTKSNLNHVILPLQAAGYKMIPNWQREL